MEEKIMELKKKKLTFLEKIHDYSLKQKEAILNEDINKINKLINDKQKLMNSIDKIDEELKGVSEKIQLDEKIQEILGKLVELDKENKELSNKLFMSIKKKLGRIRQGKKLNKAYRPSISQAVFLNKSG